jgi:hypothetical protein
VAIWGQSWSGGTGTAFNIGGWTVHSDLKSAGNMTVDNTTVTGNADVSGTITGSMTVNGTLSHPANTPPLVPCNCTTPVPVHDIVTAAHSSNDNATISLMSNLMATAPPARLDLPCGRYYLDAFTLSGSTTIMVHGKTAIFVGGGITANGNLTITLDTSMASELDVFVDGNLTGTGTFNFGSSNAPALSRLYLGGTGALDIQDATIIAGEVWAGKATVTYESAATMMGAIFANNLDVKSHLVLHNDQAVVTAGASCPMSNTPTCTTCADCNNQACIGGTCGACRSNSDCCSPLLCREGICLPQIQ